MKPTFTKRHLYWSCRSLKMFPLKRINHDDARRGMQVATSVWSNAEVFTFSEWIEGSGEKVNIDVAHSVEVEDMNTKGPLISIYAGAPFYGNNYGQIILDDNDKWADRKKSMGWFRRLLGADQDYATVMIHELGHLFGLDHIDKPLAAMHQFPIQGITYREIHRLDIKYLKELYS